MSDTDQHPTDTTSTINKSRALHIDYCPICTLPFEFCQYGGQYDKCIIWRKQYKPELIDDNNNLQSNDSIDKLTNDVSNTSIDDSSSSKKSKKKIKKQQNNSDDSSVSDDDDKQTEEEQKPTKKDKSIKKIKDIVLTKTQRQKNKYITTIRGLDNYNINLKEASKLMSKKFACSASVTKSNDKQNDEISIQGDCLLDLPDFIIDKYADQIDENNIYIKDEKSGKKVKAFH